MSSPTGCQPTKAFYNYDKLKTFFGNNHWCIEVYRSSDPNEAYIFIKKILYALSACAADRRGRRRNCSPRQPWITGGILNCIRRKNSLYKQLKCNPFNPLLLSKYKNYRNILSVVLRETKRNYFEKKFADAYGKNSRNMESDRLSYE